MKRILSMVVLALALGSAAANSYHVEYTTTAMGVPTESRCWIRRDAKRGVSVLDESQTKPFGFPIQKKK